MNCNWLPDANRATITRPSPLSTQFTRIAKLYFTTIWNWEPGSIMALMLKKNVGQLSAQWVCHILKYTPMFSESTAHISNLYSYIYYSLYWPDVDLLSLLINRRTPLFILNGDTICPSLCPFPFFVFFLSPLLNFESLAKQRWTAWWPCRLLGTTSWCCLGVQGRTPASVILLPGVWLNQRKCFYK